MFVFASEVRKGCVVVNDVGCFCRSIGGDADLWLDDQTREEVWCRKHGVEVETSGRFIVTLWVVASESGVNQSASLIDTDTSAVAADDVVHTRVDIRATEDHLTHLLTVTRGHTDRYGQFLCNLGWHTDFVHAEVWIWGDHRPSTEVDTLTGQVASESSFLTFQSLSQRLEGSSGAVTCWWDTRGLVVEVGRHVVLEKFPKVLNNQLWSARVTVFTKSLVDSENVNEFVGQVVFGAVTAVEGNRRADGDWSCLLYTSPSPRDA